MRSMSALSSQTPVCVGGASVGVSTLKPTRGRALYLRTPTPTHRHVCTFAHTYVCGYSRMCALDPESVCLVCLAGVRVRSSSHYSVTSHAWLRKGRYQIVGLLLAKAACVVGGAHSPVSLTSATRISISSLGLPSRSCTTRPAFGIFAKRAKRATVTSRRQRNRGQDGAAAAKEAEEEGQGQGWRAIGASKGFRRVRDGRRVRQALPRCAECPRIFCPHQLTACLIFHSATHFSLPVREHGEAPVSQEPSRIGSHLGDAHPHHHLCSHRTQSNMASGGRCCGRRCASLGGMWRGTTCSCRTRVLTSWVCSALTMVWRNSNRVLPH